MAVMVVTGDIGAGKSTVSKLLAEKLNYKYFNADEIAKNLWTDDNIKNLAASHWGGEIFDFEGNIIKSKISDYIFSSKEDWNFCNSILHPSVMKILSEKINDDVVIEIPLIFEAGKKNWIDKIIYVAAPFNIRAERCKIQRGWNVEELLRREKFLLPRDEKILMSDYVINNDGNINELEKIITGITL